MAVRDMLSSAGLLASARRVQAATRMLRRSLCTPKSCQRSTVRKLHARRQGSWIVNNARGAIVNVDDIKEACDSGQLGGT